MTTAVTVEYSRTISAPEGGTKRVAGSVVVSVKAGAWEEEWGKHYNSLRALVDGQVAQVSVESPQTTESVDSEPPPVATPEVSQEDEKVESDDPVDILTELARSEQPVEYTGCRVMFNPRFMEARGKRREQVRMRIGQGNEPIPGQYVDAKGEEPAIITVMQQLRQGDFVNVRGYFEQWSKQGDDGTTQPAFNLIVQGISRA